MPRFVIILVSLFSINSALAQTVRLIDEDNPTARIRNAANTSTIYEMKTDPPSGAGTASTDPAIFFLPMNDSAGNVNFHISPNRVNLPTSNSTNLIQLDVKVTNNTGSNTNLYAAVRDSSDNDYNVISLPIVVGTGTTDISTTVTFTVNNMCAQGSQLNCPTNNTGTDTELVYVFFDTNVYAIGQSGIDPATNTTGVFFRADISGDSNNPSFIIVTLSDLKKGDESVKAVYSGSGTINAFEQVIAFSHTDNTTQGLGNAPIGNGGISGQVLNEGTFPANTSGEITIGNLTNGTSINISLAFANSHGFATNLSASRVQTPEQIQAFLEEESCYLLSAGFQEKHFVIDYFKYIRDDYLLKSSWGKRFVNFYYKTAPKYTHYIYKNPFISKMVRGAGYTAYFVFNYFILLSLATLFLFGLACRHYVRIGRA